MLIAFDIDTYVCFRVELNRLIVLNTWTCNRCLCSFRLQCCWCPLGLLIVNYWYPQSLIATYDSHSKQGCDFCCWSDAPAAIVHMTDVDLTRALITIAKHFRADSGFAPSQWETLLQSKTVSHCLGANLESVLHLMKPHKLHVARWVESMAEGLCGGRGHVICARNKCIHTTVIICINILCVSLTKFSTIRDE